MIMAMNGFFGAYGEYTILSWVLFPLFGVTAALLGKNGRIKITGILLNGVAFFLVLFIVVGRTGY
jgi:hypothetical protein